MLWVLFISFGATLMLGFPIAFSMGISGTLALIFGMPTALLSIPARIFSGLDSFPLMAVPFFILAGKIMEQGGVSKRLIDFAEYLVSLVKGSLAMVAVVSSMIFAGISGSAAADTSAIGAILIPPMISKGYEKGFIACLIASAGTIGPVIPPSLLMILYSSVTGLSVSTLFLSGFLPGIAMGVSLMVISYLYVKKHPHLQDSSVRKGIKEGFDITKKAAAALVMPLIIIGGILFGVFTATEAAAIAVFYAFGIGLYLYREISLPDCWEILASSARESSQLMLIVGMATFMSWILGRVQFPKLAVEFLLSLSSNPYIILVLIIALLIVVGFFIETTAAMIIMVPVLHPICLQFGFNEIHFAMVVIITLLIGAVTPPVGVLLYLSSSMTGIAFSESLKFITPFIMALLVVLALIAFIPDIVLIVPKLFLG